MPLTPDDIKLLMGNYQNVIQMNTILLEQQKQLLDLQRQVITKQDTIVNSQRQSCDQLKDIANKLNDCATNLQATNNSIQDSCSKLGENIDTKLRATEDKDDEWKLDVLKQHSGINKNVYIAWGGMATIIIGLIGLLFQVYEKYNVLEDILKVLENIAHYFSI